MGLTLGSAINFEIFDSKLKLKIHLLRPELEQDVLYSTYCFKRLIWFYHRHQSKDISNATEDGMQRTRRRFPKNSVNSLSQYIVLHQKKVPKGRKTCPNYIRYWGNINSPF